MSSIGTLSEKSLHRELKHWYGRPGDRFEANVDGYIIDIHRVDMLIEIQTRHFHLIKRKLETLLPHHSVRVVHPIPQEKWIVRLSPEGQLIGRRKSPRRGRVIDIFYELVRIPHLLYHPNLSVELLLTQQDEVLLNDGKGSWRRKGWSIHDRRLLKVLQRFAFESVDDYCALLPYGLPTRFSNRDLANALRCRLNLAQKMTFTLQRVGGVHLAGKRGNAFLYERS